jgi:hypothetical protein
MLSRGEHVHYAVVKKMSFAYLTAEKRGAEGSNLCILLCKVRCTLQHVSRILGEERILTMVGKVSRREKIENFAF